METNLRENLPEQKVAEYRQGWWKFSMFGSELQPQQTQSLSKVGLKEEKKMVRFNFLFKIPSLQEDSRVWDSWSSLVGFLRI